MNLNLNKDTSLLDLHKAAKEAIEKARAAKSQVVAVFDVSGSMDGMYWDGTVDALATRVLALAMQLDDNGTIPVYALNDRCRKLPDLTEENLGGYTKKYLHKIVGGGTSYAPTINKIAADAETGDPMFVLLFTDGDAFDTEEAEKALIQASNLPIFFQWYGIYNSYKPSFNFLQKMDTMKGRLIDNAGFSQLGLQLGIGSNNDDQKLYEDMLKEYKDFPVKATEVGAIWDNLGHPYTIVPRRKLFGIF